MPFHAAFFGSDNWSNNDVYLVTLLKYLSQVARQESTPKYACQSSGHFLTQPRGEI